MALARKINYNPITALQINRIKNDGEIKKPTNYSCWLYIEKRYISIWTHSELVFRVLSLQRSIVGKSHEDTFMLGM